MLHQIEHLELLGCESAAVVGGSWAAVGSLCWCACNGIKVVVRHMGHVDRIVVRAVIRVQVAIHLTNLDCIVSLDFLFR